MIRELYSNREYCLNELAEARKIYGTKPYTQKEYGGITKSLSLMYLYCPEDLTDHVLSTLEEADTRFRLIGVP